MSGADVFAMEPAEVHNSVEVLFDIEAIVQQGTATVCDDSTSSADALGEAGAALGPALAEAVQWWKSQRAGGFCGLVGNSGEYLATCAEQAVEIDEYNAGDFASFADHDLYPGRANETASSRPDW